MKGIELENNDKVVEQVIVNKPVAKSTTTNVKLGNSGITTNTPQTITQAAAANFDKILELTGGIVEIKKMKVASDAVLAKMEADRKQLLAEASAYVEQKNADTKSIVDRMNCIRLMMQDFYQQSKQQISGEDFRLIITSIVDQMGRINNE